MNENNKTVSQTLENTLAHIVSGIQGIIDTAPGLDTGAPEKLAELVQIAQSLETKAERLADGIEQDRAETAPDIEAESSKDANHRVVSVHDDPDAELEFEPPARQFITYKELGITEVRGSTRWRVGKDSPRDIDDLRFTRRFDDDYSWWTVTPADTDYNAVHQLHGRSLAFQFLDLVNHFGAATGAGHGSLRRCVDVHRQGHGASQPQGLEAGGNRRRLLERHRRVPVARHLFPLTGFVRFDYSPGQSGVFSCVVWS